MAPLDSAGVQETFMKRMFFPVIILILCAAAVRAAPMLRQNPLEAVQTLFEAKNYDQVILRLQSQGIENISQQYQPQAYLLLGLSYARQGKFDKALGVLQLAVQLFPGDINALSALADLLHHEELDDQAGPLYERVLRIHPNNANAQLGLAEIAHSQGFLERSIDHYEHCLIEWSKDPTVWRAYAVVLSERLDYPKAIAAIKRSLNLDPNNAQSLESLALFQHREGLYSQADQTLRQAITVSENKTPFRLERALWFLEENDLDGSLRETQRALQDSPENPLGHWIRASIALRREEREVAVQNLRLAASSGMQFPFIAATSQAMLEQLGVRP
jgi:tetratricopeptide (TPR) repeat protein